MASDTSNYISTAANIAATYYTGGLSNLATEMASGGESPTATGHTGDFYVGGSALKQANKNGLSSVSDFVDQNQNLVYLAVGLIAGVIFTKLISK